MLTGGEEGSNCCHGDRVCSSNLENGGAFDGKTKKAFKKKFLVHG